MRSEDIYATLTDDQAFAALPQQLAELAGGRSAALYWRHPCGDAQVFAHCYFTDAQMQGYVDHYASSSPWHLACLHPARINRVWNIGDAVPDRVVLESAMYNEWVRPNGDDTFRCIGGVFDTPYGRGSIGINRGRRQAPFAGEDVAAVARLAPHLQRLMRVRGELAGLQRASGALRATLDTLALAALHVRADGKVLALNAAAEVALRPNDGLGLRDGYLVTGDADALQALDGALALATAAREPSAGALRVRRTLNPGHHHLTVLPLPGSGGAARALVLLRDPASRDRTLATRLRAMFGLSQAEAEIALALADDRAPLEIAAARGVTEGTVRGQMKSLMARLGVRRQSEVVALVLRLPALHTKNGV